MKWNDFLKVLERDENMQQSDLHNLFKELKSGKHETWLFCLNRTIKENKALKLALAE